MKKALLITFLGLFCFLQAFPQDKKPFVTLDKLKLETRADFTFDYHLGHDTVAPSIDHGFAGKYLVVALDGTIGSKFSYHLRQRLNTPNINFANTFFQGTDWAYLNWNFTDNFFLSAGKQVVAIGGWEYDTNPVDIYYGTEFWNTVCCYAVGASMNFKDKSGKQTAVIATTNNNTAKFPVSKLQADKTLFLRTSTRKGNGRRPSLRWKISSVTCISRLRRISTSPTT